MLTLITTIASLLIPSLTTLVPQWLNLQKSKAELAQQVELAKLNLEQAKYIAEKNLDIEEIKQQISQQQVEAIPSNYPILDLLRMSVRPIIIYSLWVWFLVYKASCLMVILNTPNTDFANGIIKLWTDFDSMLLMAAFSYYFSGRVIDRMVDTNPPINPLVIRKK
jgi:hypothetical protein